jgi:restriction system-associated AAA family ATPase
LGGFVKITRVKIISADSCGGILDGVDINLRHSSESISGFDPICLIGTNGTGKSQFLQLIAEIFQSIFHKYVPSEERIEINPRLQFIIEYLIFVEDQKKLKHVRISRLYRSKGLLRMILEINNDGKWKQYNQSLLEINNFLPKKVIAYTSGDNETLSLPFLSSRSGYAEEVRNQALQEKKSIKNSSIADTRLVLVDYATNLEVLISNLLLGSRQQRKDILSESGLADISSFRCIIQLAHSAAPKVSRRQNNQNRKGVQLTNELEEAIDNLKRCSTCFLYEETTETYTFDFWVSDETRKAFNVFWKNIFSLYSTFHKFSMLNDLTISKQTRDRFRRNTQSRRFAIRLPEPQDEEKVFRFEKLSFFSKKRHLEIDYASLSDGEHQISQIFGIFSMVSLQNVLFLLDEPESHFNPQWRVKFISRIQNLQTSDGARGAKTYEIKNLPSLQDCFLTTHAPFVPCDMKRENILIFKKPQRKIVIERPKIETYGTEFDKILQECFGVNPPISQSSREYIDSLKKSTNIEEIRVGLNSLGDSIEKAFVVENLLKASKG